MRMNARVLLPVVAVAAAAAAYYWWSREPSDLVLTGIVTTHDVVVGGELLSQPGRIADRSCRSAHDIGLVLPACLRSTIHRRPAMADFGFPLAHPVLTDAGWPEGSNHSKQRQRQSNGDRIATGFRHG